MKKITNSEKIILNTIREYGLISRLQLSRLLEISVTKVGYIVNNLKKKEMIQEDVAIFTGGRKSVLLKIKNDIFFAMGIDIGDQAIRIGIIDACGNILIKIKYNYREEDISGFFISRLVELANETLKKINFLWDNIAALGVSIVGFVDENKGICLFLRGFPELQNFELVEELKEKIKIKNIYLTDSVRAMALAELRYGCCRENKNFILVYVGMDLGSGIVIERKIYSGSRGIVGEISHIYVGESNEMCSCGNYGCLEVMASGYSIIKKVKEVTSKGIFSSNNKLFSGKEIVNLPNIVKAAMSGEKFATNIIEKEVDYLAIGISTMVNLLDPEKVVISGGFIEEAGDFFIKLLTDGVKAKTIPLIRENVKIIKSELDDYNAVVGVATMALDRTFKFLEKIPD